MIVRYFINEKNIKDEFGVYVSASSGVLDLPKIKEPTRQDWNEYHGSMVDLQPPRMSDREITLECFITADNQFDFISKLNRFYQEFLKGGYKRLRIEVGDDVPPLVFDTYIKDTIKITKTWTAGSQQGKFTLKLIEPNPQKKVLKFTATEQNPTCTFSIATQMAVTVTWGDNESIEEIFSDGFEASHTYPTPGTYYISIAGMIAEIQLLSIDETNTEVLWEVL